MSLKLIEKEIIRFLASQQPEVLCISGKWGVGKTYTWDTLLREAQNKKGIGFQRYSYVSLFGLNSLEDLRYSIFENTISGADLTKAASLASLQDLIAKGAYWAQKGRPAFEAIFSFFNKKAIYDVVLKAGFLNVRHQLICIDDLERAGKGLDIRDVLGLISFLKTKRECKIVILLNSQEIADDGKSAFDKQLEKVVDVKLEFDLLPAEATRIAFSTDDNDLRKILEPLIQQLQITNLRIIGKIQNAAARLAEHLLGQEEILLRQALATLILASWSVYDPQSAPSITFIRGYSRLANSIENRKTSDDHFSDLLAEYPYTSTDEFDEVIIDGVVAGYFNEDLLLEQAKVVDARNKRVEGGNGFSRVWEEMYHGSLTTDDETFLDALYNSAVDDAAVISPININSTIKILRDFGRPQQADALVQSYIEAKADEPLPFFDIRAHHFNQAEDIDQGLRAAFDKKMAGFVDQRNPLDVLRSLVDRQGWSMEDFALLAKEPSENFEKMFESLRGRELRAAIEVAIAMGNSPDGASVRESVREALKNIAKKSPLRARRVARYLDRSIEG